jgi:flagellar biogenesis protein FliO
VINILTIMLIAMKFYLFVPLFFLGTLSLPLFIFSQENKTTPSPQASETPSVYPLPHDPQDEHELKYDFNDSEVLGNHLEHTERESDTFQAKFFNMLFILALLIGFMILASWTLKRMMKTKIHQINIASTIKILETRYLSPRATLYLVEVQDQTLLIAESPTHVTYLTHLPQEMPSEQKRQDSPQNA